MSQVSAHVLEASEWQLYRDLRLRALEDSPDAFGTTLADALSRPVEDWSTRLSNLSRHENLPLIGEVDRQPAGLTWGMIHPPDRSIAHLYQMWVDPKFRGLGLGRRLIDSVLEWAKNEGVAAVRLGVTCGDTPALRLYAAVGFQPIGAAEAIRPGSDLLGQNMELRF